MGYKEPWCSGYVTGNNKQYSSIYGSDEHNYIFTLFSFLIFFFLFYIYINNAQLTPKGAELTVYARACECACLFGVYVGERGCQRAGVLLFLN